MLYKEKINTDGEENMSHNKPLIAVAGTVGVGKTTLVNSLAETLGWKPIYEEPDKNPYLERFYQDFKRWAFHLQIHFLTQRFQQNLYVRNQETGVIQDRTIYEDKHIFTQLHFENGNITQDEFATYHLLFNAIIENPSYQAPDLIVYLSGRFESILERVKKRGRAAEADTSKDYWYDLYQYYERWIDEFDACPVLKLDIEEYDLHNDADSIKHIITKISDKL